MHPPAPLTRLLIRKALDCQEALDASFEDPELSLARVGLLFHIREEPLPLSALAERMHCGKSNLTSLMDRLERLGWVERVPGVEDRRKVLAKITDKGKQVCLEGVLHIDRWEAQMLLELGTKQASQLQHILESL